MPTPPVCLQLGVIKDSLLTVCKHIRQANSRVTADAFLRKEVPPSG